MALELSRAGPLPLDMRSPLLQLPLRLLLGLVLVLQAAGATAHESKRLLEPPCPMQAADGDMPDCDCCGDGCVPIDCASLLPMAAMATSSNIVAIGWHGDYPAAAVTSPWVSVRVPPLRPPIA